MSCRLVPNLVTLNDLELRNGRYFALFHRIFAYDVVVNNYYAYLGFKIYF